LSSKTGDGAFLTIAIPAEAPVAAHSSHRVCERAGKAFFGTVDPRVEDPGGANTAYARTLRDSHDSPASSHFRGRTRILETVPPEGQKLLRYTATRVNSLAAEIAVYATVR
jgi:hypothetical protein